MADWSRPFDAAYRFVRVSRSTGHETALLDGFTGGGKVSRNGDSETYESASAGVVGRLDVGADLVRAYLDATFEDGSTESAALGTWLPSVPSYDVRGELATGTVTLKGRLCELSEDAFDSPVTVPAGANPVEYAAGIVEGCGVPWEADPCEARLSSPWTFGMTSSYDGDGGSKLQAVNALLSIAGFGSAWTDPMGTVQLRRYVEPASRAPSWAFAEGASARFLSEATDERDASAVCNVVHALYETDEGTVIGEAVDDDPASPYSVVSLGRRKVATYSYQDGATQSEADAKAAELLRTNQSVIRRVTLTHVYAPLSCGETVDVSWPTAGVSGRYAIRTQDIEMGAGCMVTAELRAYERVS